VTDEDMVVALSVGACPGGALAALKGLLEQFDETLSKRVFTTKMQKRFRRPFFSDLKALSHRENGCKSQQCLGMFGSNSPFGRPEPHNSNHREMRHTSATHSLSFANKQAASQYTDRDQRHINATSMPHHTTWIDLKNHTHEHQPVAIQTSMLQISQQV